MSFSIGTHVLTLDILEDLLYANRAMATATLIAATLFFYDHLTTLSAEINLVWRAKWNIGKILFLLVRYMMWPELCVILYYDFIGNASDNCRITHTYSFYSLLVGITVADVILVLRTWAIWNTKRSILILLLALLFGITAVNFYLIAATLHEIHFYLSRDLDPAVAALVREYHICFLSGDLREFGVLWSTVAGFELVVFGLTAMRAIVLVRGKTPSLVYSLYRDGMLYFVYIFGAVLYLRRPFFPRSDSLVWTALSAANVVLVYTNRPYTLLLGPMQCAFHSILCCRLVLHIRAAAHERERGAGLLEMSMLSTVAT